MAVYHNSSKVALDVAGSNSDNIKSFLAKAKSDVSILKTDETATFLAREIGRKLFGFLLKSDEELNASVPLSQLGMDSLVGVRAVGHGQPGWVGKACSGRTAQGTR